MVLWVGPPASKAGAQARDNKKTLAARSAAGHLDHRDGTKLEKNGAGQISAIPVVEMISKIIPAAAKGKKSPARGVDPKAGGSGGREPHLSPTRLLPCAAPMVISRTPSIFL